MKMDIVLKIPEGPQNPPRKVAIVGMGALGMLFGKKIQSALGRDNVAFAMDRKRYERSKDAIYTINGERQDFALIEAGAASAVDLVIVATKYAGLHAALDTMRNLVGERTAILSLLNGISSEEIIAAQYGDENIVPCVAIGMDAVREGGDLRYSNEGRLQIGAMREEQRPALAAVAALLAAAGISHTIEADIRRVLWGKFMLNVGINQVCMVYDTTYGGVLKRPDVYESMVGAMREALTIARLEGVHLTEDDLQNYLKILHSLQPGAYPSMRQDALAKRKSEVELFAGTVLRIAAKYGASAPINQFYYDEIRKIESAYG